MTGTRSYRGIAAGPGSNIYYRANPVSALDVFAAARMYHRGAKRGVIFRRRVPGVNQANAIMVGYQPVMKADSLIEGSALDFFGDIAKREISDKERRIALATNTAGVVAAPAAIYAAVRSARRKEGGLPREIVGGAARRVLRERPQSKAAKKVVRAIDAVGNPKTTKSKVAAATLGGAAVGLQLANATGDFIAARAMKGEKKDGGK